MSKFELPSEPSPPELQAISKRIIKRDTVENKINFLLCLPKTLDREEEIEFLRDYMKRVGW